MILDCRMPDMDGFKVVEQLRRGADRRDADNTVVLMLSSDDLNIQLPRVRELGLDAYIVKPVRRTELLAAIATALAARTRANVADTIAKPPQPSTAKTPYRAIRRRTATCTGCPSADGASGAGIDERLRAPSAGDDSADNRLLIKSYLRRMPYRIEEAENGQEAFQKAIATRYDLILMDLQMPVVDGLWPRE